MVKYLIKTHSLHAGMPMNQAFKIVVDEIARIIHQLSVHSCDLAKYNFEFNQVRDDYGILCTCLTYDAAMAFVIVHPEGIRQ